MLTSELKDKSGLRLDLAECDKWRKREGNGLETLITIPCIFLEYLPCSMPLVNKYLQQFGNLWYWGSPSAGVHDLGVSVLSTNQIFH